MPQCSSVRETNLEKVWDKSHIYVAKSTDFYFKLDLKILDEFQTKWTEQLTLSPDGTTLQHKMSQAGDHLESPLSSLKLEKLWGDLIQVLDLVLRRSSEMVGLGVEKGFSSRVDAAFVEKSS